MSCQPSLSKSETQTPGPNSSRLIETPSLPLKWVKRMPAVLVTSVNSVAGADEFWGCVAAGSATSRRNAIDALTKQNASEHGKGDLPRELSPNVGPCVTREVSLGSANVCSAVTACS